MPFWEWLVDSIGVVLFLLLLYGLCLVIRRRWISRNGGTFEFSVRVRSARAGRGEISVYARNRDYHDLIKKKLKALGRWMEIRWDLPLEWQEAGGIGNFRMWATASEMREFATRVYDLAKPLRKPPDSPDAERRETHVTLRVLPQEPSP